MEELWKPLPTYKRRYEASNLGRVRLINGGKGKNTTKIISTWISNAGYESLKIWDDKKHITKSVHQLIAYAWIGVCPENMEVHHIDRNRLNNTPENLMYVTREHNLQDRNLDRCRRKVRLSYDDVSKVIDMYRHGFNSREIGELLEYKLIPVEIVIKTLKIIEKEKKV